MTSNNGLLTTLGYKLGSADPAYALEGSIAITGALVQWFRDNIGLIGSAPEIETLALTVEDNGGCYFVPAFSGLFAPHWRSDARGVIAGLTGYINRGHLARAVLEATAWQTREVVEAMNTDYGSPLSELRVDGGMTANNLLMQYLADVLDVPVMRPIVAETVSLGAAYTAGLAVGSGRTPTSSRRTGTRRPSGSRAWTARYASAATGSGRRRWRWRSTGSTTTSELAHARVMRRAAAPCQPAAPAELRFGSGLECPGRPILNGLSNPDHSRLGRFARLQDVLDEHVVEDRRYRATDQRPDDRHPEVAADVGVVPRHRDLPPSRDPREDARPEVTSRIDRVAGVGTERDADRHDDHAHDPRRHVRPDREVPLIGHRPHEQDEEERTHDLVDQRA